MIRQFAQFRQAMRGRDPQAMVQNLLSTGRMTPEQFEALKAQAVQLQQLFK